jgi:hypothetical protein
VHIVLSEIDPFYNQFTNVNWDQFVHGLSLLFWGVKPDLFCIIVEKVTVCRGVNY